MVIAPFDFATVAHIVFGSGVRERLGEFSSPLGKRALVVTGRTPGRAAWALALLAQAGATTTTFAVPGEPSVNDVEMGAALARTRRADFVVAIGGGSVIDAGKAIAALATNDGAAIDYLEVVGAGRPLGRPPLPSIAVPTTAGTGSEATRNAVLTVPDRRVKVSLRNPLMLPRVAIIDPELSRDLPPSLTASTGLDALTQLIEAYVSVRAQAMTDPLCVEGIRLVARSLRTACRDGTNAAAREAMALASLWSGIALANAGLGAVHGLAGPIGGMFEAPHGAVCAALLPHVCAANLRACRQAAEAEGADPAHTPARRTVDRFAYVARLLTGDPGASPEQGVEWLGILVDDLQIPGLAAYGIADEDISAIATQALRSSSMKGNPCALRLDDLSAIVRAAL